MAGSERPPRLHGGWLAAFSILGLPLLPLAVAMPALSMVARVQRAEAATTREARAAGAGPGDAVVSVDGHKVREAAATDISSFLLAVPLRAGRRLMREARKAGRAAYGAFAIWLRRLR